MQFCNKVGYILFNHKDNTVVGDRNTLARYYAKHDKILVKKGIGPISRKFDAEIKDFCRKQGVDFVRLQPNSSIVVDCKVKPTLKEAVS